MVDTGPEGDTYTEKGAGLEGDQQYPFLEGNISRKTAQWLDGWFQFPNCQCIYKKGATQETASWKFSIQPSLTTFPLTVDVLVKAESFVKKMRLFLLQVLCFSWNDWMPKRWNF